MARIDDVEIWGEQFLSENWDEESQRELIKGALDTFQTTLGLCESPIEKIMLAGLISTPFGYADERNVVLDQALLKSMPLEGWSAHVIVPQMAISQFGYRADFYVSLNTFGHGRPGFIIECDGHDFHERTKYQAARDRKRDRDIQSLGIPVLRFTGSELHKDPEGCFAEVDIFGCDLIEKRWIAAGKDVFGYRSREASRALEGSISV